MKGKRHSPEHIKRMSEMFSGAGNPFFGKKHSEELLSRWRVPGSVERRAIKKTCHGFIWNAIGRIPSFNAEAIIPELGWSPRQLREHLEKQFQPGMLWENHGVRGWHVDHIRPISSFPIGTPLSIINELKNLRPLWATDNLKKGGKWNGEAGGL